MADVRNIESSRTDAAPALVVGLGASAGGIKTLRQFFAGVPADTPFTYVVILHLSAAHESRLAEVLQTAGTIPITQVNTTVALERGAAYVVPPNAMLEIVDGHVSLQPMADAQDRRAPVDFFFRTLADSYGPRAVAIVLSGTGPNGSNGLKRVKECGGLTIAQDPEEADYRDMPDHAIASGMVDYVLPAASMPHKIHEYYRRVQDLPPRELLPSSARDEHESAREILALLRVRTGHDFANYKPGTIRRRIERRMSVTETATPADYLHYIRTHPLEASALMKELLISVTNFFRDAEAFQALEQRAIPRIFEGKQAGDQVRVWSAACATGEEAYALGMLLLERASVIPDPPAIQIFATDLDEDAIAAARTAVYHESDVADVSRDRLKRFFQRDGAAYQVRRELREIVLFAKHNVIRDPPFSHLDLISCRNLLIYLNRAVQDRVLETFHFALRPGGILFLGMSESPDGTEALFAPLDKTAHIFESRSATGRLIGPMPERALAAGLIPPFPGLAEPKAAPRIAPGDLHLRLLEAYAPPSLVVGDDHAILHVSEKAARYLRVSAGEPSRDLFKAIAPELRVDLQSALQTAAQQNSPVEVQGARFDPGGAPQAVTIRVRPVLRSERPARGYFLVLFQEEAASSSWENAVRLASPTGLRTPEFEEELASLKEQLRGTIEQYETQAEESKAANEELQAMNEELRSAAEELETSREELQSVNEELTTVNQELKIKIDELGLSNNDFLNLINSSEIAAIFLDRALRVKLSTPRAQGIFNLLDTDTGRRLSDITNRLTHDGLHDDVKQVLETLQTIEREVQGTEGRWYAMRIVPYRTTDDRIEGVSITFHDITRRYQAEQRARAGEERLRALIDSAVDYAIFTMTPAGVVDSWNAGAERMYGYEAESIIGQPVEILFTPEDRAAGVPARELARAAERGREEDERWHLRQNGTRFFASGVTTRLGERQMPGFAKIARDLTAKQEAAMALEQARVELEARVRQRTAELQQEVIRRSEAQEQIAKLLGRLVTAQEDQRARIARDLHDHLGQHLTALRLTLERSRALSAGAPAEELDRAMALAREVDTALDYLAWELRPAVLDHLGLELAIPRLVEEWSVHYGVEATTHVAGTFAGLLPRMAEITFYRVAQEALNNVAKHARASRVDVLLERQGEQIVMVVEDNGSGFDTSNPSVHHHGFGLLGMRERAALVGAELQVESSGDSGTAVFLRYDIPPAAQPEPPA
jgi:two-component system CheB/CheR fusion protein